MNIINLRDNYLIFYRTGSGSTESGIHMIISLITLHFKFTGSGQTITRQRRGVINRTSTVDDGVVSFTFPTTQIDTKKSKQR